MSIHLINAEPLGCNDVTVCMRCIYDIIIAHMFKLLPASVCTHRLSRELVTVPLEGRLSVSCCVVSGEVNIQVKIDHFVSLQIT